MAYTVNAHLPQPRAGGIRDAARWHCQFMPPAHYVMGLPSYVMQLPAMRGRTAMTTDRLFKE